MPTNTQFVGDIVYQFMKLRVVSLNNYWWISVVKCVKNEILKAANLYLHVVW